VTTDLTPLLRPSSIAGIGASAVPDRLAEAVPDGRGDAVVHVKGGEPFSIKPSRRPP